MPADPLRDAAQALLRAVSPIGGECAVCVTKGGHHQDGCEWMALRAALAAADTTPVELPGGVIFDGPPPRAIDIDPATIAPPGGGTTPDLKSVV